MTPADLTLPNNSMIGSTKRFYDKILSSHTAIHSKYKGTPTSQYKVRETGTKSEMRERMEKTEVSKAYYTNLIKKNCLNQSIDAINSLNNKIKLMKKNKTIEDMLIKSTPSVHYRSTKHAEHRHTNKMLRKNDLNSTVSKRSINSNSKSRSSNKGSKEFGRLITKSKLRLSGNISMPTSSVSKYSTKVEDVRVKRLEETNALLRKENGRLRKYIE